MRAFASAVGLGALALLLTAPAASAQPSADPSELPPLPLGPVPQFSSEIQARGGCAHDVVVWADPNTGYFYPRWHKRYGRSPHGSFTCLRDALRGDYWNINPFANNPKHGREFPIDPSLLDYGT